MDSLNLQTFLGEEDENASGYEFDQPYIQPD
jgi:hypothetical protein